jgi:Flp pilus assembly protein TadG
MNYLESRQVVWSNIMMTRSTNRRSRTGGAEMLEFTLTFLPLIAMIFALLDIGWAVFAKSTLQYAVRVGVRRGITITGAQATLANSDLTSMVKDIVQNNSLGLLAGSSGRAKIQVHYYLPPPQGTNAAPTDVSTQTNGNVPLNIMQVSVVNFSLGPLAPRVYSWKEAADKTPNTINVAAVDQIEPSRDVPAIGSAP